MIPNVYILISEQIISFFGLLRNVHCYINAASLQGYICLPDFMMTFSNVFENFDSLYSTRGLYK